MWARRQAGLAGLQPVESAAVSKHTAHIRLSHNPWQSRNQAAATTGLPLIFTSRGPEIPVQPGPGIRKQVFCPLNLPRIEKFSAEVNAGTQGDKMNSSSVWEP